MLIALAIHSTRIAIDASPAPRNTALMRNSIRMTPLKPIRIAVNEEWASTSGVAPISASSGRAKEKPSRPTGTETSKPSAIACTAAIAAPSGLLLAHCAGRRWRSRPMPEAHRHGVDIMVIIASVRPTVATASGPTRETKNTSTTANTDSSTSLEHHRESPAARSRDRFEPSVYEPWCDPASDSRIVVHRLGSVGGDWMLVTAASHRGHKGHQENVFRFVFLSVLCVDATRQASYGLYAIASISTRRPSPGSPATCTVVRAGRCSPNIRA